MRIVCIVFLAVIVLGCDNGGSSSGSTANVTDSNTSSPDNIGAQYAGTYRGKLEGTYTAPELGLSDSDSTDVEIVIRPNGETTVSVEGRRYTGSLDTDQISAVVNVNETYDDITCNGTVNVDAQISGNTIRGTANGAGQCRQGTVTTPVRVAGVLNASR